MINFTHSVFLIVKLKMWYILIAKLWHNLLNILHIFGESYVKFRAMRSQCWCLQDQTVTGKYYCNVSKRLRKSLRRKRPEICRSKDKFLHQDNAQAHTSLVVRQFPPPYSPDLAPFDFFLFPKMKLQLKKCRFDLAEERERQSIFSRFQLC